MSTQKVIDLDAEYRAAFALSYYSSPRYVVPGVGYAPVNLIGPASTWFGPQFSPPLPYPPKPPVTP